MTSNTIFNINAKAIGAENLDYGANFTQGNTTYTVVGIDTDDNTFPIVGIDFNGKVHNFTKRLVMGNLIDYNEGK